MGKKNIKTNFVIKEEIGELSQGTYGWTTQINLISWFGKDAKYDIRSWNANRTKCDKGARLTEDELRALYRVLHDRFGKAAVAGQGPAFIGTDFVIEEEIGELSQGTYGWTTQINLISWFGEEAKYDIRSWNANRTKYSKATRLTEDELRTLYRVLHTRFGKTATTRHESAFTDTTAADVGTCLVDAAPPVRKEADENLEPEHAEEKITDSAAISNCRKEEAGSAASRKSGCCQHMGDTDMQDFNELTRVTSKLLQELGREPSLEEIAREMNTTEERVREIMKIHQLPVPLETPRGEEEDSRLGDFIEDHDALAPADAIDPIYNVTTSDEDHDAPASADAVSFTLLREQLEEVLSTLTSREKNVLELRFGLVDGRSRTQKEVAEHFGVTRERIRQIEAKALRKLRHPDRSRRLKDFLD